MDPSLPSAVTDKDWTAKSAAESAAARVRNGHKPVSPSGGATDAGANLVARMRSANADVQGQKLRSCGNLPHILKELNNMMLVGVSNGLDIYRKKSLG